MSTGGNRVIKNTNYHKRCNFCEVVVFHKWHLELIKYDMVAMCFPQYIALKFLQKICYRNHIFANRLERLLEPCVQMEWIKSTQKSLICIWFGISHQ